MKSEKKEKALKENSVRVILNVPNDIDNYYKDLSTKRGISKSAMILYAMSWFMDYNNNLDLTYKTFEYLKNPDIMKAFEQEFKKDL